MSLKSFVILLIVVIGYSAFGQDNDQISTGKAVFITSKNVYVKFDNTELIKIGDTLQTSINEPCLLVSNKSSSSVVCTKLFDCDVNVGDSIRHKYTEIIEPILEENRDLEPVGISYNDSIKSIEKNEKTNYLEDIRARLSLADYSTLSNIRDDNHRIVTRFSLNADHINNSKYSVETYLNYRKDISENDRVNSSNSNDLRVFNLAVKYDVDSTLSLTLGRKINYKISSMGATDGVQAEKSFGKNYVGAIAGFRPDIFDFGFNTDLTQYGAYVGRLGLSENARSQTTLGVAEQRNKGDIDRRFGYFQHSSTFFKKLNIFSVVELDLYNKINDSTNGGSRLTNLYVSARYRINRKINMALSYDSRKRIIYYKTYETEIEQLLDEDLARQGIRARINLRPFKSIFGGFSYSKRFQSDNQNKSDNIYGYLNFSRIPVVEGRVSVTYNRNSSNYLDSNISSIRYSKDLMDNRMQADFYYRFVNYKYKSAIPELNQHYFGTYISYYLDRSLVIALSGEYSTYGQEHNFRINSRIIKRFFRQRKKINDD